MFTLNELMRMFVGGEARGHGGVSTSQRQGDDSGNSL